MALGLQGISGPALAQAPALVSDAPELRALVEEALATSPEVAAARLRVQAQAERVPVEGALPDPVLSLGYQNDGLRGLALGEMETTWFTVMASQTVPWAGKRGLRAALAQGEGEGLEAQATRAALSLTADVQRAWLELALTHERIALLDRQAALWASAEQLARARYAAGGDAQLDVLRIQLERRRLEQGRALLTADLRVAEAALNRLCGRPLGDPLPAPPSLLGLALPAPSTPEALRADALERSPELAQARAGLRLAEERAALVELERRPDLTFSAGLMPRGALEPMWQVGVSAPVPVYARGKQGPALSSARGEVSAAEEGLAALERLVLLRAQERAERQAALYASLTLYEGGLLDLSEATLRGTLDQYAAGRGSFAAVLEAMRGTLGDQERYLEERGALWEVILAQQEVDLGPTPGGRAAMGTASIPAAGGGATPRAAKGGGAGGEAPATSPAAMSM